ncbi:hypothetical protein M422DRAFT_178037 [Sphaerobolus stellatus SS14]|uniref:Unplaced genomic scaffold SPHSTscaffold_94, whole genome shotgun sequence n=1 Tax=Sphaerobolus stellatus (strain SS14) TaxID=990650 RepID=A0A0C9VIQ1_SPHS4|nr:hypothetical protein M422DRAFT_178037 [Sphaerobolus stellatus SS14]
MARVVSIELISRLATLYPTLEPGQINPWSFVAATAFSASNFPEAVPLVFQYALKELDIHSERLLLARKFRDALFKSGILSGYPKAINALVRLNGIMPDDLKDTTPLRDSRSTEELTDVGQNYFDRTYGDTAISVQNLIKEACPDLDTFSTAFAYGYVYSFAGVLSPAETSFATVAALIPSDVPRQIDWHLRGAVRNGASIEELKAVRQISIEASQAAGVRWMNEIPEIAIL